MVDRNLPRRQKISGRGRARRLCWLLSLIVLLVVWNTVCPAQQTSKRGSMEQRNTTGITDQEDSADGMPREIGKILELSDSALQSGNNTIRYLRQIANASYDWLLHLRISVVENDRQSIRYDRENCELLFELLAASNPSTILRNHLLDLKHAIEDEDNGNPSAAMLSVQLDLEKFAYLYPLMNLREMLGTIFRAQQNGKIPQCKAAIETMHAAVGLINIDGPMNDSQTHFQAALAHLNAGEDGDARRELKNAANLISLLNIGAYITESQWHLARAQDAVEKRLFGIALASLKKVNGRLQDAQDRSWKEFAQAINDIRVDVEELIEAAGNRERKLALSTAQIRSLAQRVEDQLVIPY
ncbi:MAG: hypothetical protein ABIF77_09275 [bacterium]